MFKGHWFPKVVIFQAVYYTLRFALRYQDIEELLRNREPVVGHATILRWVFKFAPMIARNFRKPEKAVGLRWRLDEHT